jgi:tetratricopeptide (TPR) repeat protein
MGGEQVAPAVRDGSTVIDRLLQGPAGYVVVAAVALAVRLLYLSQLTRNPFFDYPILDAHIYDQYALKIAAGQPPVTTPFFHPPLYPYFLGLLYDLFGRDFVLVRLVQGALGACSAVLTFHLARGLLRPRAALASGLAAALYGTLLFYESELLAPGLIILLNLVIILLARSFLERPRPFVAAACGACLGFSALAMPVVLPFAVVLPLLALRAARRGAAVASRPRWIAAGLLYAAGLAAVIGPVTVRNAAYGDPVLIAYNGGVNMFLGTGADYDEKVASRPGPEWDDRFAEPVRAGRIKPSEQSAYYVEEALRIIADDPLGYAALLGKKLWLFLRGNEIMRNQEIYPFRAYSPLLAALLWKKGIAFPAGVLLPLALIGAALAVARRHPGLGLLVAFVACHVAVLLLFFVTARYRVSVVPPLIVLAGYAGQEIAAAVRGRRWRFCAAAAGALALLGVASNAASGPMPTEFNSDAYYSLGVAYRAEGRPGARALFAKAVAVDPKNVAARIHLGTYLDLEGRPRQAIAEYEQVLARYPRNTDALYNKAVALHHLGDGAAASATLRRVLAIDPDHSLARQAVEQIDR